MLAWKPLGVPRMSDCDTDDSQKTYLKLSLTYTTVSSCLPGGKNSLFHFPDFIYPLVVNSNPEPPREGDSGKCSPSFSSAMQRRLQKEGGQRCQDDSKQHGTATSPPPTRFDWTPVPSSNAMSAPSLSYPKGLQL